MISEQRLFESTNEDRPRRVVWWRGSQRTGEWLHGLIAIRPQWNRSVVARPMYAQLAKYT